MANYNEKPSNAFVSQAAASVVPQSVAAAGTATGSGWVSVKEVKWAKVTAFCGAGGGTLAVKIQQASDSSGTGVKDLITAANLGISALDGTAKIGQADCNIDANIDVDNSFAYVRLHATVSGGSGTIVAAGLELGPAPRQA